MTQHTESQCPHQHSSRMQHHLTNGFLDSGATPNHISSVPVTLLPLRHQDTGGRCSAGAYLRDRTHILCSAAGQGGSGPGAEAAHQVRAVTCLVQCTEV
jgi:hypothetical protein